MVAEETKPSKKRKSLTNKEATSDTITIVAPGQILASRYKLKREVARGGMGIVFEAVDTTLNDHRVAIKVLPPEMAQNEAAIVRLKDEALSAIKLTHANIMRLHSFEQDGKDCFLVMEYLDGDNLELELAKRKKIPLDEVVELAQQAAAALDTAHEHKLVHRDIKPANMMFTTVNDKRVLKITDFGIAYEIKDSMTRLTGTEASLTPQYASPEQLQAKRLDGRTDQYSLAATVYELLEGRPPFGGAGLTYQIINAQPEPVEGIPEHANAALAKALAKDPKERFSDCASFVKALSGEVPVVVEEKTSQKRSKKAERSPLVSTLIGLVVVFLLYGHYKMPEWFGNKSKKPLSPEMVALAQPTAPPTVPTAPPTPAPTKMEEVATPPPPTTPPTKMVVVTPTVSPTPTPTPTPTKIEKVAAVPPQVKTEVIFTTTPKGAKVFCKQANLATGKIVDEFRSKFLPGDYTFVAVKQGYRRYEETHTIPKEDSFALHIELAKEEATLVLTGLLPEARVKINQRSVGREECARLLVPPGRHRIFVEAPGKIPFDKTVAIKDQQVKSIDIVMEEEEVASPPRPPLPRIDNINQCFELFAQSIYNKEEDLFSQLWTDESRDKGMRIYKQAVMNEFKLEPKEKRQGDGKGLIFVVAVKDGQDLDGSFLYLEERPEGWRFIDYDANEQRANEFVPKESRQVDEKIFEEAFHTFIQGAGEGNRAASQSVCDDGYWQDYGAQFYEMLTKLGHGKSDFDLQGADARNGRAVFTVKLTLEGRPMTLYLRFEQRPDGVKLVNVVDSEATNQRWLDTGR